MKIKEAKFVTSAVSNAQYPKGDMPQIALVGKSNVGKSSLINVITNDKRLARTSSQPGKTRLINFFSIDEKFYLVNLPGYGFARVSDDEKIKWANMINEYLEESNSLKLLIMIIDIRHNPTGEDLQMAEWIKYYNIPTLIAASKADKLGKTRIVPQVHMLQEKMGFPEDVPIIPYSAVSKKGITDILKILDYYLEGGSNS